MGKMKGRVFQLYLAFATSFGQLVLSLLSVWPSYTCRLLESDATPLSAPMTKAEESLLGSLPSLGAMVGTAVVGTLIDRLGRKNGGILLSLPFVISWAMIASTTSIKVVLAARFFGGIAGGGFLVYAPIYISEVADDSFRGTLASGLTLLYCFGILLSYIFGWMLSYQVIIYTNVVFSLVGTLLLLPLKESPVYLLKVKRYKDARDAIAFYRGCSSSSETVQEEFVKLKQQIIPTSELHSLAPDREPKLEEIEREKLNLEREGSLQVKKLSSFKMLFLSKSSNRAFWVVLTVMSTQVFMGIVPVQVYAESVFQQTDPRHANLYSVIFALVLTFGSFVPAVIADKVGRRILLISSSILVCLCLLALGFLLQQHSGPPWLSILVVMMYCFSLMYGASSVPYVLLAEVFVSEIQNLASILIIEWVWFLNFVAIAIFPYTNTLVGMHGTFYCFAFVSLSNAVICYYIVPETTRLSNAEIQLAFLGTKMK